VRALADFFGVASFRGGPRVVVVSPAEGMNAITANALLKMLEEPPPRTLFVLVAHALDEVLPTIRSRCVLLQVPVPERAGCERWLAEQGVAESAAALALASGAPLAAFATTSTPAEADALYRLLEAGPALTAAQVVAAIGRDAVLQSTVRLLQCWAYDLLSCRLAQTVRYHPQRSARIARIAVAASGERLWTWISSLHSAAAAREHPLNARLVIESLLVSYVNIFDGRR
jgi:DNA polymerase-3 subunit delta'